MSRHQAYRNYDYENDLDEYEGEGYSDREEELDPEDQGIHNFTSIYLRGPAHDKFSFIKKKPS